MRRQYSEQGSATKKPISGLTRAGDADTKTYLAGVADNEVCFLDVYGTMQGQPLRHDGRIVCCAVLQGMKLIVTGTCTVPTADIPASTQRPSMVGWSCVATQVGSACVVVARESVYVRFGLRRGGGGD